MNKRVDSKSEPRNGRRMKGWANWQQRATSERTIDKMKEYMNE